MPRVKPTSAVSLSSWLAAEKSRVDAALERALPARDARAGAVHDSMRYTLMLPGKRLRALLVIATGEIFRAERSRLLPAACMIEMIHASSLILDDLPCMDGATLRRGQPVNHKVYGEAVAVLASVSLLTRAFEIAGIEAAAQRWEPAVAAEVSRRLAEAVGADGLIAGQVVDLASVDQSLDFEALEYNHSHKTGCQFIAAAESGGLLGGARPREMEALHRYAKNLGLAFQITDDVLDATGTPETTGKDTGLDRGKTTFVTFASLEGARKLNDELIDAAQAALEPLGEKAEVLVGLAEHVRRRTA
jgi:geranylgeranyl diphosphate synthase type II